MAIEKAESPRVPEYQVRTFEELRAEILYHLPHVDRLLELIAIVYDRLTLIEGLSYKEAFGRIREVFKEFRRRFPKRSGFSDRNLYRYLPYDNPTIPHRNRPPKKDIRLGKKLADTIEISEYAEIKPEEPNVIYDYPKVIIIKKWLDYEFDKFDQEHMQFNLEMTQKHLQLQLEMIPLILEIGFNAGRFSSMICRNLSISESKKMTYKYFLIHQDRLVKKALRNIHKGRTQSLPRSKLNASLSLS